MSSVELKVIHIDVGTAEDDHRKDVLRWGFKPVHGSSDSTFLWAENGRLWANTLTAVPVAQPSVPITQSFNNPSLSAANTQIYVRASLPRQDVTYALPLRRVAVDVNDRASRSHYVANVEFEDEGFFRLHVDTGSSISWVCGFDRRPHDRRFDLTRTPGIPGSRFEAAYVDGTHVRGILCNARATFSDGAFCLNPWPFCVATSANDEMRRAPVNEGVLGLSYLRPPGGSNGTQLHPGDEAETFIESIYRAGLIDESFTFCVKLRRRSPGVITFGKLPDLGSQYNFQNTVAGRWALPSKRISITDGRGRGDYKDYSARGGKPNAALFDTGTDKIFIDNDAVDWLYGALLGQNNHKAVGGTRYIEPGAVSRLKHSGITFYFGNRWVTLPAKMLQGKYSQEQNAYAGTIQGKSGGAMIDDAHWTFDIMGTAFFRQVWVAFDTEPARPKIAIHVNTYEENHED